MKYPALIVPDGQGFVVSFRDVPEALTGGPTRTYVLDMARDALGLGLEMHVRQSQLLPTPSALRPGEEYITLGMNQSLALELRGLLRVKGYTNQRLADKLGISNQEVSRILSVDHHTGYDRYIQCFEVLGHRLEFLITPILT